MTTPRAKGTPVPEDFKCDDKTLAWIARRYPNLDVELAEEVFVAWAVEYLYANHQKAFQNFLIREDDKGKIGKLMKKSAHIAQQNQADLRAKQMNFRKRNPGESDASYMFAMDGIARSNVTKLSSALK